MKYNYFGKKELTQFQFYKMPIALIESDEFKKLSNDSKILYSIMLGRTSLSIKSKWIDKLNRVYIIITASEISNLLNCGKSKVTKLLQELETFDLIERKKLNGPGKPDIIYVKNFNNCIEKDVDNIVDNYVDKPVDNVDTYPQGREKQASRDVKSKPLGREKQASRDVESKPLETWKASPNKIYNNKINNNRYIDLEGSDVDTYISDDSEQTVIELYNQICTALPTVNLTKSRKKSVEVIQELFTETDIVKCFELAQNSDFLTGKETNFQASFDWLMKIENFQKVINNNYNRSTKSTKTTKNKFVNHEQRDWDFDEIERMLQEERYRKIDN